MLLNFAGIHVVPLRVQARRCHVRPLIHVGQQQSGTDSGPVVQSGAAIPVPARANLEIKWTVDAILLCPEDGGEMLCHARQRLPAVACPGTIPNPHEC